MTRDGSEVVFEVFNESFFQQQAICVDFHSQKMALWNLHLFKKLIGEVKRRSLRP